MRKILIVEDEKIIAESIKHILAQSIENVDVLIAENSKRALELAKKENPKVILMDINLKDELDGIQTAELIRQHLKVPVIYLTAYAEGPILERAKKTEPVSYLLKPFNELELKTNVEIALYKSELSTNYEEKERWLAELITQLGMGIIKTNRNNEILMLNDVARKLCDFDFWEKAERLKLDDCLCFLNELTGEEIDLSENHNFSPISLKLITAKGKELRIMLSVRSLVENSDEVIKIFILEDLSAKLEAEQKIWSTRNLLEQTFYILQDAILFLQANFTIIDCNPAVERLFGYRIKELLGQPINILWEEEAPLGLSLSKFNQIVQNALFYKRHAMEMRRKDGIWLPVEISLAPLNSLAQNSNGWILTITDDSERRAYEKKLRAARDEAEAANQAKSQFLANISHELRTPLNSIIGITELTLETELSPDQRESLEIVKQSALSFLQLLNTILDYTKIEIGKLELEEIDYDLFHLFRQAIETLKPQALKKNLTLSWEIEEDLPRFLKGDPLRLRQVLLNIIGNAIKFTEKGYIKVNLKRDSEKKLLVCDVEDTGIGIPEDKHEIIFQSFVQADGSMSRRYGGTGLGLTIAKRLLEMMQGTIEVKSKVNEGSIFTFRLPIREGRTLEQTAKYSELAQEEVSGLDKAMLKILVVEDDLVAQKIIQRVLEKSGHTVFGVSDGNAAIEILHKVRFDLVLMDIEMPVLNGWEATCRIRELQRSLKITYLPIIAMTAHARPEDRERCFAIGMDHYLAKPIDLKELSSIIKSYEDLRSKKNKYVHLAETEVLSSSRFSEYKKEMEKEASFSYNKIEAEFLRYIELLGIALEAEDVVSLEKEAEILRKFCLKVGALTAADNAFRLKLAGRKKTLHKAKYLLSEVEKDFKKALAKMISQENKKVDKNIYEEK